jgi:hypothetical protein
MTASRAAWRAPRISSPLEIDEPGTADSPQDAEDVWLPVLAALQLLVNPP